MTDAVAPDMLHINVVCICCSATAQIWIAPEEISPMRFVWSPLDNAYLHTCGKCLYQRVDADAPIKAQRVADPERTLHHRRQTGARAAASVVRMR